MTHHLPYFVESSTHPVFCVCFVKMLVHHQSCIAKFVYVDFWCGVGTLGSRQRIVLTHVRVLAMVKENKPFGGWLYVMLWGLGIN